MKRFYVVFKGRVQGVGFRWTLSTISQKYKLTGYCRNLLNGDVEAEIQGNNDNIQAFLKEVLNIKGFIRIDDYTIKNIDLIEKETDFKVDF